jgi:hypothetical protein
MERSYCANECRRPANSLKDGIGVPSGDGRGTHFRYVWAMRNDLRLFIVPSHPLADIL